jgi:hypothetical protein
MIKIKLPIQIVNAAPLADDSRSARPLGGFDVKVEVQSPGM